MIFLMTSEVMFLGFITTLLITFNYLHYIDTYLLALIVLTLAAIETAIGLCILVEAKVFVDKLLFSSFHVLNG